MQQAISPQKKQILSLTHPHVAPVWCFHSWNTSVRDGSTVIVTVKLQKAYTNSYDSSPYDLWML